MASVLMCLTNELILPPVSKSILSYRSHLKEDLIITASCITPQWPLTDFIIEAKHHETLLISSPSPSSFILFPPTSLAFFLICHHKSFVHPVSLLIQLAILILKCSKQVSPSQENLT